MRETDGGSEAESQRGDGKEGFSRREGREREERERKEREEREREERGREEREEIEVKRSYSPMCVLLCVTRLLNECIIV